MNHDVTPLQIALNANGAALTIDGVFGVGSQAAMRTYQRAHGLTVSDQPTREVCAALGITLAPDFPYQPIAQPQGTIMNNILGGLFQGLFKNLLNWTLIQGYIRSALLALGGGFVTAGRITGNQLNDIVAAILVIIGIVWQAVANNTQVKAMAVVKAVDQHPSITVIPADASPSGKPIVQVAKTT